MIKRAVDLALRVAIWVVDKSRHLLDVAKAALYVARGVVYVAKRALDVAIAFLEATYRVGVSALTNFVLTQIINIREQSWAQCSKWWGI